jgi:hypothetical protein
VDWYDKPEIKNLIRLAPVLLFALLSGCIPATTQTGVPGETYYFPPYSSALGPLVSEAEFGDQAPSNAYMSLEGCSAVAKVSDVRALGLEGSRKACIQAVQRNKNVDPLTVYGIVGLIAGLGLGIYTIAELMRIIASK